MSSSAVLSILDFLEVLEAVTPEDLVEVRDKLALIEEEFALMVADHHKNVAALRHLETILDFLEVLEAVTPEDLVEVRDKLALIEEEFALMVADHHKHVAALRHLETILAFRLGEVEPVAQVNREPQVAVSPAEPTVESDVGNVALVDPTKPGWPCVDNVGEAIAEHEANEAAQPEGELSKEISEADYLEDVSDDDNRSIEERIREKLLKLGSRSARQLGAMLGIEKSTVFAAMSSSSWFQVLPGSKGSHDLHWQLTAAGKRGE